VNIKAQPSFGL